MIELRVSGKKFKYFSSVNVSLSLDTIASTFSFNGYFNIDDNELKQLFKPFSYLPCEVWMKDEENEINERLITGTILNPALSIQRQKRLTGLSGYSKTGILEDVNTPIDIYPLQMDGLTLAEIAKKYTDYFGLSLVIRDNAKEQADKVFEKAKADPTQSVKDYLSKLCRDRNVTLSHDNLGRLLIYKTLNIDPPRIKINQSDKGVIQISSTPNGQSVHSDITVITQAATDTQSENITKIISPFAPGTNRPRVAKLKNGEDTEAHAKALASAEAKNFPITIELEGWTFQNKIVRAGFYIEVTAPDIFIDTTKLVIERIVFKSDPQTGKTQTITAVLPCIYTGELPAKSPFI
jgi:prophage tail gpP-like protein